MQYIYLVLPGIITENTYISINLLDIFEIESANGLYLDVEPISTACRDRVRVAIESDYHQNHITAIFEAIQSQPFWDLMNKY